MSGSSAPAAPNYAPIAQAQQQQATLDYATSQDQLAWAKQQYADQKPFTDEYQKLMLSQAQTNNDTAQQDRARYQQIYQPIEDKQADTAMNWDSPERKQEMRSRAAATVGASFDAADAAATRQLQGYGVNPGDLRMGAINRGSKLARAASAAGAENNSDVQVDAQGNALRSEAINVGRGYPGSIAGQYGTATQSGASGVSAANTTTGTYMPALGNATAWSGLGNQSLANSAQTMNMGFQNANASYQSNQNSSSGIGSALGAVAGIGMMAFSDKRLKENIRPVGKTKDGQTLHEFNFKGDPKKHIGLIAQEVEKKHPEAVSTHPSGYKMVDYGKALHGAVGGGRGSVPAFSTGGAVPSGRPPMAGPGGPGGAVVPIRASVNPRAGGDTVPAALEPGEMVIPKQAVQWHGEKHFQKIIQKAHEERAGAPAKPQSKPMPGGATRPTFVSPGASRQGAVPVHAAMALRRAA